MKKEDRIFVGVSGGNEHEYVLTYTIIGKDTHTIYFKDIEQLREQLEIFYKINKQAKMQIYKIDKAYKISHKVVIYKNNKQIH